MILLFIEKKKKIKRILQILRTCFSIRIISDYHEIDFESIDDEGKSEIFYVKNIPSTKRIIKISARVDSIFLYSRKKHKNKALKIKNLMIINSLEDLISLIVNQGKRKEKLYFPKGTFGELIEIEFNKKHVILNYSDNINKYFPNHINLLISDLFDSESIEQIENSRIKGDENYIAKRIYLRSLQDKKVFFELIDFACTDADTYGIVLKEASHIKNKEELLSKEEANLHSLIENANDAIWSVDKNYYVLTANNYFREIFLSMFNAKLQIGDYIHSAVPDIVKELWSQRYNRALDGERFRIVEKFSFGGEDYDAEVFFSPILDNKDITGVSIIARDITERKRIEKDLLSSEQKYRLLIESASESIYSINSNGIFTSMNKFGAEQLGYSQKEVVGKSMWDLFPKEIADKQMERIDEVLVASERRRFESFSIVSGKERWFYNSLVPIKNGDGFSHSVLGISHDITELKIAEEALRNSENRYREIVEKGGVCIVTYGVDGKIIFCNNRFARLFGRNEDELLGMEIWKLIHPEDNEFFISLHEMNMKGTEVKGRFEVRGIKREKEDLTFEVENVLLEEDDEITGVRAYIWDISDRKKIENALKESEERYKTIFTSDVDTFIILDSQGNILEFNNRALHLYGYKREEFSLLNCKDLTDSQHFEQLLNILNIKIDEWYSSETVHLRKNGEKLHVSIHGKKVKINDELNNLLIVRDISARKKAENELKYSEKKIRTIFNSVPNIIFVIDLKGKIIEINDTMLKLCRHKTDLSRFINSNIGNFISLGEKLSIGEFLQTIMVNDIVSGIEGRFMCTSKREMSVEINGGLIKNDMEDPIGYILVMEDITQRMEAEEKIIRTEKRYTSLFNEALDMLNFVDSEGKIVDVNKIELKTLGYIKEELIGKEFYEIIDEEYLQITKQKYEHVINGKTIDGLRSRLVKKNNERVDVEISAIPEMIGDKIIGNRTFMKNITEKLVLEKNLKKSHSELQNLTRYLENAIEEERTKLSRDVHDIVGQNLTAIRMDINWILEHSSEDASLKKLKSMLKIVEELIITVQKISTELRPGMLDDLGLEAAFEWYCDEFQKRFGVKCILNMEKKELILSDENRTILFRIFQEALTNVARHSKAKNVEISVKLENDNIQMQILDDGIGITENKIDSPSSLGLIGMRERAKMGNGVFSISPLKKGTLVTVILPIK